MIKKPLLAFFASVGAAGSLEAATLRASDAGLSHRLGSSVSVSGAVGLVGAGQADNTSPFRADQGAAYAFRELDTATGIITQAAKLTASDGLAGDQLGGAVSLWETVGLAGARFDDIGVHSDQGSAYVFRNLDTATGTITENAKLIASDGTIGDEFGSAVSLFGTVGLVGASMADIGSHVNRGAAYLFRGLNTATGTNTQNAKLTASDGAAGDLFGESVSLSGTVGLVGAYGDDVGSNSDQGSAYVFRGLDTATGTVTQHVKLTASDGAATDFFGRSVSLSGTMGLVGARLDDIGSNTDQGSAYLFRNLNTATGTITQDFKLTASDGAASDLFGIAVSLSGSTAIVGASGDDIGSNANQGSAYLFRGLDTGTGVRTQNVKIWASSAGAGASFGAAVSLDGDNFLVGATEVAASTGRAYSGSAGSLTTLDVGNASRSVDGISFESWDDWIVGQTTDSNTVTLFASNSATVTNTGKAVYIGQNAGSDGNTLVVAGSLTANGIRVGVAGNSNNVLQIGNGGANGTLSAGSVITNNGRLVFNRSDNITQGTHFGTSGISGTGAVVKLGPGTLTFNATNTFAGSTTVSNGTLALATVGGGALAGTTNVTIQTGAALLVSASSQVNDSATVTLSGGTIRRGAGVSEVFGNLNLTAASFLDYGTGATGTLRFGTYTPGSLLTVTNFAEGNLLVFGSNLSGSITNTSLFSFDNGFTYAWDSSNAIFTITAIPEPSTVVAALGLLGLVAGAAWRRRWSRPGALARGGRTCRSHKTSNSCRAATRATCALLLAAFLLPSSAHTHEAAGGNIRIFSTVDLGGTVQTGGSVQFTGFVGEPGVLASASNVVARQGGNSFIYYATNFSVSPASLTINEQGAPDTNSTRTQLRGDLVYDDATVGSVDAAQIAWMAPPTNSALASISSAGLAQAATVYQNTAASFSGTHAGLSATSSLTVLNVLPDNFGAWAGDTFDDAWEISQGMSGAVNPNATNSGVPNWQLYAMGFNPAQPAPAVLASSTKTNGYLALRYTRNPYATNYSFVPQQSGNLPAGFVNLTNPVAVTNLIGGVEQITVRGSVPMNLTNRQFLRVRVIRNTP